MKKCTNKKSDIDPLSIRSSTADLKKKTTKNAKTNPKLKKSNKKTDNLINRKYSCDICQQSFRLAKEIRQHIGDHVSLLKKKPYKCDFCQKTFRSNAVLSIHLKLHNHLKKDENQCLICDQSFESNSHLYIHMSMKHKGIRPYRCEFCTKVFSQRNTLSVHQQTAHLGQQNKYECTVCKMTFESADKLTSHMDEVHHKTYKCLYCIKCFRCSYELQKHERTHTMERPYKCTNCDETFSLQNSLQLHIERVHKVSEERPVHCPLCDYSFVQYSDLNSHIFVHIDESPFECPDCALLYEDLKMFQEHVKLEHDRPFDVKIEPDAQIASDSVVSIVPNDLNLSIELNKSSEIKAEHSPDHSFEEPDFFDTGFDDELTNDVAIEEETAVAKNNVEIDLAKMGVTISYNCPMCELSFTELQKFNQHTQEHISCTEDVENDKIIDKTVMPEPPIMPPKMRKTEKPTKIREPVSLDWQKRDNKVRNYSCDICNSSYTLASSLRLHVRRTHMGIKPYECKVCGYAFAQSSDLIKHMRKHTGERPYKCSVCNVGFTQNRNLKNHMKLHTANPSKCKYCNKTYLMDTSLIQHVKKHEGLNAKECEVCKIPFAHPADLNLHMKRLHGTVKSHVCDVCGKTFKNRNELRKHSYIHTGVRLYICHICNKTFSHATSLRNHRAVHSGERPFQCSSCGQSFSFLGNLKVHMRCHTGERPFGCELCTKKFARAANLKEHIKIHTGDKSYVCDVCNKAFVNSSTYSKHKKIHTGQKPYKCSLCERAFIQMSHLTKHFRIHTGEKPYDCKICKKQFRRSDTLAHHLKTHKKDIFKIDEFLIEPNSTDKVASTVISDVSQITYTISATHE